MSLRNPELYSQRHLIVTRQTHRKAKASLPHPSLPGEPAPIPCSAGAICIHTTRAAMVAMVIPLNKVGDVILLGSVVSSRRIKHTLHMIQTPEEKDLRPSSPSSWNQKEENLSAHRDWPSSTKAHAWLWELTWSKARHPICPYPTPFLVLGHLDATKV